MRISLSDVQFILSFLQKQESIASSETRCISASRLKSFLIFVANPGRTEISISAVSEEGFRPAPRLTAY
jgi:hypothetical protein